MKKIYIIIFLQFCFFGLSQDMSCSQLVQFAKSQDKYPNIVTPFASSMLVKVEYYKVSGGGLVIAYIKKNDFDYIGNPYIFCGISSNRWSQFTAAGPYGWGEAFHKYIRSYTCDCN